MKWSELPLNPTPRVLRQFAVAWLVVFLALALHQTLARHHQTAGCALGVISLIGIIGLAKPAAIRCLFIGATILTFPVGWAVTQVMLAVMFYLVLTPIGLWLRRRGRDELQRRPKPEQTSFWIPRGKPPAAGNYLKQY